MPGLTFAWSDGFVGRRVLHYPPEEGDRTRATGQPHWSPVESLPRERLEAIQLERLRVLLGHVEAHSPFYAARWREAGVAAADVRELSDLDALPVVTKEDFEQDQLRHPPYGSAFTVPPSEQMKLWQTSGTSGPPRLWAETKEDWENGMYMYSRALHAHGVRPGWRAFLAFGYPPFIGFWLCHYAAEMMGCQLVPKGPLPTQVWLGLMQRLAGTAPGFVCATPTYAQRQMETAREIGIDLSSLGVRLLTLAGEPGACVPSTKAALELGWGATVHDVLGSTETSGPVLFTCEAQAALAEPSDHAQVDYFILEVLDPTTHRPLPDGERGSLCVTALGRAGMPAVRFLLNDHVSLRWESCACGRTFPLVLGGVAARADDMMIIKGVNLYPSLIENLVRQTEGLSSEYLLARVEGTALVRAEAAPEVAPELYPVLSARLRDAITAATTLRLGVDILSPGTLPRSEAKSKRLQ